MIERLFVPHIAALPHLVPFVGPEALERKRGRPFRARLGANESSFGPSPHAIAVVQSAARENWKYADPENHDLIAALAKFHSVPAENIMVGEGIDGLLGLTCMIFVAPGDAVVTSDGAYPTFNFHVAAHGGNLIRVPMRDDREDLQALVDTARHTRAKLLYVSNPNSPIGTHWPEDQIIALIAALPSETVLVLDEAYIDTAPARTGPAIDITNPNVIRYRTFSKAYGLAGARIGYALGHKSVIAAFDKVRNHYGINRAGQLAALAALRDQAYLAIAISKIARARERLSSIAANNGLAAIPSATSFVAIDCGDDGIFAQRVLDGLLERDVFARKPVAAGIDRCIRVSCGIDTDIDVFAEALPAALAAARVSR